MTYNDYLIKITNTMQIRSTDYRLSQNDITILANNIYQEIALECTLGFIQQEVLIVEDQQVYDLNDLYTQVGNELPLGVMSIRDDKGNNKDNFFVDMGNNVFKISKYVWEYPEDEFFREYAGRYITFNRQVIPDIEALDYKQQTLLFNPIIEGIMWYVHDAIPNPTSSNSPAQETSNHYTMYQNAKKILKNQLPQRI